jgi:hypothetical protein
MRQEVMGSIQPGVYQEAWTQNNYGKLLKDNAERVKEGDRAGALLDIQNYRTQLSKAYEAAPSPAMKHKMEELGSLEAQVNDAFSGPDQDLKAKRLSKGYQYQGVQSQRKTN